jgi:hypothetical protein
MDISDQMRPLEAKDTNLKNCVYEACGWKTGYKWVLMVQKMLAFQMRERLWSTSKNKAVFENCRAFWLNSFSDNFKKSDSVS